MGTWRISQFFVPVSGSLVPPGSFDKTKAAVLTTNFGAVRSGVDVPRHLVHPEELQALMGQLNATPMISPPALVLRGIWKPQLRGLSKFAFGQFRVDAARTACALEQYRLAHGSWPASLDPLAAPGAQPLPHDVCNGEPLHYSVRPDGTYLLYSVGWNQRDDQGQIVKRADFAKSTDEEQGDWVWPQPGHPGS